jgi:hypothetical protein
VTIIERCESLRAEVAGFGALRNADSDARVLRELQARISEHCDGLQHSVVRFAVLKEEQVRLPIRLKVDRLRDVVVKMRDEVSDTRRRPADAANFLRSFKKLVGLLTPPTSFAHSRSLSRMRRLRSRVRWEHT